MFNIFIKDTIRKKLHVIMFTENRELIICSRSFRAFCLMSIYKTKSMHNAHERVVFTIPTYKAAHLCHPQAVRAPNLKLAKI
jgi:hypothetical protein